MAFDDGCNVFFFFLLSAPRTLVAATDPDFQNPDQRFERALSVGVGRDEITESSNACL